MSHRLTQRGLAYTVQDPHPAADLSRVNATVVVRDERPLLELTSYHQCESDAPDDEPALSDMILLSQHGWQELVALFALRFPQAAARIVAKAQGWLPPTPSPSGGD